MPAVARIVVVADFLFTATAVVAQPITGVAAGLDRRATRCARAGSCCRSLLYLVTGAFWLPVVWMQMRMRDLAAAAAREGSPCRPSYHRLFRLWFAFGFPAFAAVLGIFWLMIARPQAVVAARLPTLRDNLASGTLGARFMTRFRLDTCAVGRPGGHEGWAAGICSFVALLLCLPIAGQAGPLRRRAQRSSTPK